MDEATRRERGRLSEATQIYDEKKIDYQKKEKFANAELRERRKDTMGPARGQALGSAGRLAEGKNIASRQRRKDAIGPARGLRKEAASCQREPNTKARAKDAEAAKVKGPEESVTEAGKPEESATVGSSKSAMDQELIGPNCSDDEEILRQLLQFKLDRFGNCFIQDEAEENQRRAMLKAARESMARTKKAMLHWPHNLPTKVEQSRKAEAPVTESATVGSSKSAMEQLLKDKLDILDLEEDSKKATEPAADPNSVTIQDDHVDRAKSALAKETADEEAKATLAKETADEEAKAALAKETADEEEEAYDQFRKHWEDKCCKDCDHFQHKTVLSSMQFTYCTPGMVPYSFAETLQIFSMKLKLTDDNAGGFELPLSVYGMVAVRDALDSRRNILFSCDRTMAQELTQDDPFLHFTGPSRAILSADKVYFEIRLRVKGATGSQDKPLITCVRGYAGGSCAALCFDNALCTLEMCLQTVEPAVQATILAVQIVKKKDLWPLNFRYGGLVACTPLPRTITDSGGNKNIVLIESKGREMPQGNRGYVPLSRQVVCVEDRGGLDVVIQAYKKSGAVGAEGRVHFKAQNCHISQQQCIVGQAQVTVTVAWSVVPTDMDDLVFNSSRRFQAV
ncbi:hypothetical protein ACQJBY_002189 [Aegilops geniculata]